jgi:hypothetical protein
MPTYLNASDETIVIGGMTFLSGESKVTSRYFRMKPVTTTGTILAVTATPIAGGTGYHTGDVLTLAGGTGGTVSITQVDGVVTAVALVTGGTGYTVGTKATTGGFGTLCTVAVTSIEGLTISDDEPYVTPLTAILSETSFPTAACSVLAYPALYIHNMTTAVASIRFNGASANAITIPAGEKVIIRNDESINSALVYSAGTGTVNIFGLKNKNSIEV